MIGSNDAVLAARLDDHVAQRHPLFDVEGVNRLAVEFHGSVGGPVAADVADYRQDQILGHEIGRHLAVKDKTHRLRSFHPELAGPQDEAGVGVADARGELAERTGRARVAVGAEQNLPGPGVTFFRQGDVANALIPRRADIVKVFDVLLGREMAQNFDIAVGHLIRGEDIVVGNNDDLVPVPDLGVLAEMLFEDADSPRAANVMGHQQINIDPNVIAGLDAGPMGSTSKDFFRQGHRGHVQAPRVMIEIASYCSRNLQELTELPNLPPAFRLTRSQRRWCGVGSIRRRRWLRVKRVFCYT